MEKYSPAMAPSTATASTRLVDRPAHDAAAGAIPEAAGAVAAVHGLAQEGHPQSVHSVTHGAQQCRQQGDGAQQSW